MFTGERDGVGNVMEWETSWSPFRRCLYRYILHERSSARSPGRGRERTCLTDLTRKHDSERSR